MSTTTAPTSFRSLSIKDVVSRTGFSDSTIRAAIGKQQALNAGDPVDGDAFPPPLPAKKAGRTYSVRETDLATWWESLPDA